jgi:hypothetical protein
MKSKHPPKNVDYSLFLSNSGMKTKMWGPHAWNFLFVCILGAYPKHINKNNKDHLKIQKEFKKLMKSLPFVLPCVFCRNSFKGFLKELPLEPYLTGRIKLFYWLYLMKDKVNQKLIRQEKQSLLDKRSELKQLVKDRRLSKEQASREYQKYKREAFKTQASPPFIEVLRRFETFRAGSCSEKAQTCN